MTNHETAKVNVTRAVRTCTPAVVQRHAGCVHVKVSRNEDSPGGKPSNEPAFKGRTPTLCPRTPHLCPRTPHLYPRTPHLCPRTLHLYPRTPHLYPRTPHLYPRTPRLCPRTLTFQGRTPILTVRPSAGDLLQRAGGTYRSLSHLRKSAKSADRSSTVHPQMTQIYAEGESGHAIASANPGSADDSSSMWALAMPSSGRTPSPSAPSASSLTWSDRPRTPWPSSPPERATFRSILKHRCFISNHRCFVLNHRCFVF